MMGYLSASCVLILLVHHFTPTSAVFDDDWYQFEIPEEVKVDNLQIDGIEEFSAKQRTDILGVFRHLPALFHGNEPNLKLVPNVFTKNATMVCGGQPIHPRTTIAKYIEREPVINSFSVESMSARLERGDQITCQGMYIWNGRRVFYFRFNFIQEEGQYKIDYALMAGC